MNRFEEEMIPNAPSGESLGTGYLITRVATARGAIPLENAFVNVRSSATGGDAASPEGKLIASLRTDKDGLTPRLALPAPLRRLSEQPGAKAPYAQYDIDVFMDGYSAQYFKNVPIFDTITSLQTADLIPLPEGQRPELGQNTPSQSFTSTQNPML